MKLYTNSSTYKRMNKKHKIQDTEVFYYEKRKSRIYK